MKILAIRIKNLASIEGEFEIDFKKEPLQSAGIFAITGPTGSGKSTILDAICLALFAKTPRITEAKENGIDLLDISNNKIKQGDNRNILRKGTSDAYAEVDFIGIDKQSYRSSWSVRRAGNKIFGNLQNDTIELTNLQTQTRFTEKKTETLKEIERLLGLNYDQFTRSVLLAQGDFTAFLKAEKDEKSSLLEKLTGTEIYSEISKKIFEKFRNSENELKDLIQKIDNIKLLTDSELFSFKENKNILLLQISKTENQIKKNTEIIKWYELSSEMEKDIEEACLQLKNVETEKAENKNRYNTLKFVEAIQSFKNIYDNKNIVNQNLQKKISENNDLDIKIKNIKELIDKLSDKKAELENLLKQVENEKTTADPEIKKAKELDIIIAEKKQQYNLLNIEIENDQTEKQKIEEKISINNNHIKTLVSELQKNQNWINENKNRRQIAEQISLINSKFEDLKKEISHKNETINDINKYQSQYSELENKTIDLQAIIEESESKLIIFRNESDSISDYCKNININDLNTTINNLNLNNEKILRGIGIGEQLIQNQNECTFLNDKIEKDNESIISYKNKLEILNNQLINTKLKKEQTQKILSKAEIATTHSVEILRQHLSDNEECPVCGSIHHPYIEEKQNFKYLLTDIRNELNEINIEYENYVKEFSAIESLLDKTKADIDINTKAKTEKTKTLNESENLWFELDFKIEVCNKDALNYLNNTLLNNKKELNLLLQESENYNKLTSKNNDLKGKIEILEKHKTNSINESNIINTEKQNINLNKIKTENILISTEKHITDICNILNLYFTNNDWFAEWNKNNNLFENKLKRWVEDWFANLKKSEESEGKIKNLETENQIEKEKLSNIIKVLDSKQINLIKLNNIISKLAEERNDIFGGKDINLIENLINEKIKSFYEQINQNQNKYTENNNELIKLSTIYKENGKEIDELNTKLSGLQTSIAEWINKYNTDNNQNINIEEIENNLHYNQVWIEKENIFFRKIDEEIIRQKSKLDEKQNRYKLHINNRLSDLSNEEAFELLNSAKTILEEKKKNLNEIEFTLKTNENNHKTISKFKEEIEIKTDNYDNWYKINELIGSADGKKFRQIAQEYTLDILLNYANKQLSLLSSRYFLKRIENTLALQVIDKDMGNETRSVYSLSGGESFIVSLALALGLASLSSNKMQVESLFIDEGFGSLDPATLSIAMDALEQLYNQGRKVGVISHIQEMTERIPTQIRLIKQINGKSKIEITGY